MIQNQWRTTKISGHRQCGEWYKMQCAIAHNNQPLRLQSIGDRSEKLLTQQRCRFSKIKVSGIQTSPLPRCRGVQHRTALPADRVVQTADELVDFRLGRQIRERSNRGLRYCPQKTSLLTKTVLQQKS